MGQQGRDMSVEYGAAEVGRKGHSSSCCLESRVARRGGGVPRQSISVEPVHPRCLNALHTWILHSFKIPKVREKPLMGLNYHLPEKSCR